MIQNFVLEITPHEEIKYFLILLFALKSGVKLKIHIKIRMQNYYHPMRYNYITVNF